MSGQTEIECEIRDARTEVEKWTAELEATQQELSAKQAYVVMKEAVQGLTREELAQGVDDLSDEDVQRMGEQKELQLRKLMGISQELGHRIDLQVRASHSLSALVEKSEARMEGQRVKMLRQETSLRELQNLVREQAVGIEQYKKRDTMDTAMSTPAYHTHRVSIAPPVPIRVPSGGTEARIRDNILCNVL